MSKKSIDFDELRKTLKKALKTIDTLYDEADECVKDIDDYAETAVELFYAQYPPTGKHPYHRTGGLKSAYKLTQNGLNIGMDFDARYMIEDGFDDYHQDTEIVYNNVFVEGYHGGSYGEGNTFSVPAWRTPYPCYNQWYQPAPKSFSLYNLIGDYTRKRIKSYDRIIGQKLDNITDSLSTFL